MARKQKEPEPKEDVPKWFMTYSDVITLLMTFFILLLTFATNEPERFEKMKISMFGGAGSSGIVRDKNEGVDRDSLVTRIRPKSATRADRGAEMPPVDKETSMNALDKGLKGLEDDEMRIDANSVRLELPIESLASPGGRLSSYGKTTLDMLAKLSNQRTCNLKFQTNNRNNLKRSLALLQYLSESVAANRLAVQYDADESPDSETVVVLVEFLDGIENGTKKTQTE